MKKHEGKNELTWFEPGFFHDPFATMRRLANEMEGLFEGGWHQPKARLWGEEFGRWVPPVEVWEHKGQLHVRVELPGLHEKDVGVEVTDNTLVITGERKREHEEEEEGYHTCERIYGAFHRAVPLPEGANAEEATAAFKNGVLEVTMPAPKPPEKTGRRIEVKAA